MFTEDLDAFFQAAEFAIAATYKPGGVGAGSAVNVVFDHPGFDALGMASTKPTALGKASDFAGFSNADTLTISGTVYRIVDSSPQDDGAVTLLQLEKQ